MFVKLATLLLRNYPDSLPTCFPAFSPSASQSTSAFSFSDTICFYLDMHVSFDQFHAFIFTSGLSHCVCFILTLECFKAIQFVLLILESWTLLQCDVTVFHSIHYFESVFIFIHIFYFYSIYCM